MNKNNMKRIPVFIVILCLVHVAGAKTFRDWEPGDPVEYLRKEAPPFRLPELPGQRYAMLIPETLDQADRALLGLKVLTESLEPSLDYEQNFWLYFNSSPAVMTRDFSSVSPAAVGMKIWRKPDWAFVCAWWGTTDSCLIS
jgi:hypothetical protein